MIPFPHLEFVEEGTEVCVNGSTRVILVVAVSYDLCYKIAMITDEKVAELGKALADINRRYTAEGYGKDSRLRFGTPPDARLTT